MLASTYGWKHSDILDLTARQFFLYLKQVFKLHSAQQLRAFEASLLPHMEISDRIEVMKNYRDSFSPIRARVPKKEIEDTWDYLRKRE